ncbi:hypothetical protein EJ08DRAFT_38561 [Tothia fuscella]|uniref:Uncharacterized protein n=1 Tax=Tothia fuscella TaxID=1048955 RepID=A0A9P4NZ40_9PEZI|nr:hypothetical protein EJ08DRAFT_38561 [Tothia fuscella]
MPPKQKSRLEVTTHSPTCNHTPSEPCRRNLNGHSMRIQPFSIPNKAHAQAPHHRTMQYPALRLSWPDSDSEAERSLPLSGVNPLAATIPSNVSDEDDTIEDGEIYPEAMDPSIPPQELMNPEACLTGVATEVRLKIFRYLLPDADIVPCQRVAVPSDRLLINLPIINGDGYRTEADLARCKLGPGQKAGTQDGANDWKLRKDDSDCIPAVMSVCRQFYAETWELMYHHSYFVLCLSQSNAQLCGQPCRNADLNRLGLMKNVVIFLAGSTGLPQHPQDYIDKMTEAVYEMVLKHLCKSKQLRKLVIMYSDHFGAASIREELLEEFFRPFQNLNSVQEVTLGFYNTSNRTSTLDIGPRLQTMVANTLS